MSAIVIYENDGTVSYTIGTTASAGPFAIDFPYFFADEIAVFQVSGPETRQLGTSEYILTGVVADDGFHSGSVTLTPALSNCTIRIDRTLHTDKAHNFPEVGAISIPAMNTLFSRIFSLIQDLKRWLLSQLGALLSRILALEADFGVILAGGAVSPTGTVDSMAALQALTLRPEGVWMEGYYAPGDGGGGWFYWVEGSTTTVDNGMVVSPSGTPLGRYKRGMDDGIYDPHWWGAKGDGITDDSAAFNACAATAAGKTIRIGAGTFQLKSVIIRTGTTVVCGGGAIFRPFNTADLTSGNYLFALNGSDISWTGGTVQAPLGNVFATVPTPYYCFVSTQLGSARTANLKLRNILIVGGRNGFWIPGTKGTTIENCECTDQHEWGLAFPLGPTGFPGTEALTVRTYKGRRIGKFEGLKVAAVYQATSGLPHLDLNFDDLLIEDCGRLDPDTAQWQEGFDLFVSAAQRIRVSNFTIRRCGNGGIELKRQLGSGVSSDFVGDVFFQNGRIDVGYDQAVGFAFNHNTAASTSNSFQNIMVQNVGMTYSGPASPTGVVAVALTGSVNVTFSTMRFVGVWSSCFNFSAGGSTTDQFIIGTRIYDCACDGSTNALFMSTGKIDDVLVQDCTFITTGDTVVVGNGLISANDIRLRGGWLESNNGRWCLQIGANATLVDVYGVTFNNPGSGEDIEINGVTSNGLIRNCVFLANSNDIMRVDSPNWRVYDNFCSLITNNARLARTNANLLQAWNNVRGTQSGPPGSAGAWGEVWKNAQPGATLQWVCTTPGDAGAAVWTAQALP